ncbi:hypothetical protein GCM10009828_010050 [Actinoplanes couchii]|uniref:RNA polymerase sigma factor 70 region 4 type 2 domain-containing protein n=1 Tax=Actinoplanes couchii TaxID=403638 RepID=A0ABQ3XIX7_9ACTN|nr:hypothetical protein [Actinoplanes couchii]GID58446.1 hypothetical protein Aco03nite_068500 [Actinoplanes couchii]
MQQTAAALKCPEGTVKVYTSRGLDALRQILGLSGPSGRPVMSLPDLLNEAETGAPPPRYGVEDVLPDGPAPSPSVSGVAFAFHGYRTGGYEIAEAFEVSRDRTTARIHRAGRRRLREVAARQPLSVRQRVGSAACRDPEDLRLDGGGGGPGERRRLVSAGRGVPHVGRVHAEVAAHLTTCVNHGSSVSPGRPAPRTRKRS